MLRASAYRLRFAEGVDVPEHDTEMVCGDIAHDTHVEFMDEGGVCRIATDKLRLQPSSD